MPLFLPPSAKILLYWFLILIGSLFCEFYPIPASYLSDKRNVMNQYFVKVSWGWTCSLLGLFIIFTSSIYSKLNLKQIARHLSRLVVSTAVWYVWVNVFQLILDITGYCEGNESTLDRRRCRRQGLSWIGFDISGHTFLLIYCVLVISEEVEVFEQWDKIGAVIKNGDNIQPDDHRSRLELAYKVVTPLLVIVTIALAILSFLWEFMLVCTSFYFHTVAEKTLGYFTAVVSWFLTYHVWYKCQISPGCPPANRHNNNVLDLIKA